MPWSPIPFFPICDGFEIRPAAISILIPGRADRREAHAVIINRKMGIENGAVGEAPSPHYLYKNLYAENRDVDRIVGRPLQDRIGRPLLGCRNQERTRHS